MVKNDGSPWTTDYNMIINVHQGQVLLKTISLDHGPLALNYPQQTCLGFLLS